MITTEEFEISQGRYLTAMAMRFGRKWLFSVMLLAAVCVIIGVITDYRWIIISLMLIMLVMPMMAAMLYFNYGLRPEGFVNTLPHKVAFLDSELQVTAFFTPFDTTNEVDRGDVQTSTHDKEPSARIEKTYHFNLRCPVNYQASSSGLVIPIGKPCRGVILVPYRAFETKQQLEAAIKYLN